LHEVMVPSDEARNTLEFGSYFVIVPFIGKSGTFHERLYDGECGTQVAKDFCYNSEHNAIRMTVGELREFLLKMNPAPDH